VRMSVRMTSWTRPAFVDGGAESTTGLRGEDLRLVGEGLELQGVAGRVEEEHRPLLAGLALEAEVGLDDELRPGRLHPVREVVEVLEREDGAEVGHRHLVLVDGVVPGAARGAVRGL